MQAKYLFSNASKLRQRRRAIPASLTAIGLILFLHDPVFAQAPAQEVRLAEDVVPAPDGFDKVTAKYTAARPTDVYISPFIWAGKVKGLHFNAGQPVDVLAKPRGYDWLLVGKDGTGIGYIPLSVLSPAKQ